MAKTAKKADEFPSLFQNRLDMVVKGLGVKMRFAVKLEAKLHIRKWACGIPKK